MIANIERVQRHMGDGFLLAHPLEAQELTSPFIYPARGCSYQASITQIRQFAAAYVKQLPRKHPDLKHDFSRITMHSLRSWLATLTR